MKQSDQWLARRTVIKGAGLGLVACGFASSSTAQAATAVATEGGEIWSEEYWTRKGDIPLWMFRKRIGAPKPGEPARPAMQ